jgi:hypothetical protein
MKESPLEWLKRFDDQRPSVPGEHWLALAAGLWLMTRHRRSALGQLAGVATGAALVYRAASGRDGLARRLAETSLGRRLMGRGAATGSSKRYFDLGAPWPQAQRVRVPAISQPVDKTMWTP